MTENKKILVRTAAAVLTLLFWFGMTAWADFRNGCRQLKEDMLRLHIIAQSDSAADQALKLAVRDRILELSAEWAGFSDDKQAVMTHLAGHLYDIEAAAGEVILENGCYLSVKAELSRGFFDTRVYDGKIVPAGWYDALRVTVGEGAGKNWWCVLYPPLCLPAAEGEAVLDSTFTAEEKAVLSSPPRYKICFLTVELAEKFLNWLKR